MRYFAVSPANCGLALLTIHSARSMWLSAAPAVTNWPDLTIMFESSNTTFGYRLRKTGASHHVVVAC